MNNPETLNPGGLSFDQFVAFFFNHPEGEPFWYADARYALAEVVTSSPALVDHLTRLFSDFVAANRRYSPLSNQPRHMGTLQPVVRVDGSSAFCETNT